MFTLLQSIKSKIKGLGVAGIFVDLQKAFGSVWVNGLIYKLHQANVTGRFLALIDKLLEFRKKNYT